MEISTIGAGISCLTFIHRFGSVIRRLRKKTYNGLLIPSKGGRTTLVNNLNIAYKNNNILFVELDASIENTPIVTPSPLHDNEGETRKSRRDKKLITINNNAYDGIDERINYPMLKEKVIEINKNFKKKYTIIFISNNENLLNYCGICNIITLVPNYQFAADISNNVENKNEYWREINVLWKKFHQTYKSYEELYANVDKLLKINK